MNCTKNTLRQIDEYDLTVCTRSSPPASPVETAYILGEERTDDDRKHLR